jgi:mannosylglycoprotein endo-beta-mannosidase
MSGMKINFEKSEIFTIGLSEEDQRLAVTCLGCKIGMCPMKCLGMPIRSLKISKAKLSYVSEKTEKRLGIWQCEYLSSGGKSTLIDSCLSNIPMYTIWECISCMRAIFKS